MCEFAHTTEIEKDGEDIRRAKGKRGDNVPAKPSRAFTSSELFADDPLRNAGRHGRILSGRNFLPEARMTERTFFVTRLWKAGAGVMQRNTKVLITAQPHIKQCSHIYSKQNQ